MRDVKDFAVPRRIRATYFESIQSGAVGTHTSSMSVALVPATMAQIILGASCDTWAPYMCNGELKFYEEATACAKLCPAMPACEMDCPVSLEVCSCSFIAGCECGEAPIDLCGCQTGCPPEANGPCMLVPPPNPFAPHAPASRTTSPKRVSRRRVFCRNFPASRPRK